MNAIRSFYFVLLLCLSLSACVDDEVPQPAPIFPSFDYAPLFVGKYQIFQVDSILFDTVAGGVEVEQVQWLVRERITDSLRNDLGQLVYRLERSQRPSSGLPWEISDIWTVQQIERRYERVEDNLRFIKMVVPLEENRIWNGNAYIDETQTITVRGESIEFFKNWQYQVLEVGVSEEVAGQLYDEVATLQQADDENLIEIRYAIEKYAKGVGLIYRELQIMDTQCGGNPIDCDGLPWAEKAQKGFILTQVLLEGN